jgi:hypothetical protein
MAIKINQSAIAEAKDQLFLDTADGQRLNNVSSNLGLFRPILGIGSDAEWRAIVKKIAHNPKLIQRVFRHIIECCIGPRFTRTANLSAPTEVGDNVLFVNNAEELIQLGTLVIDSGLPTEETITFDFVDRITNKVILTRGLTYAHQVLSDGSGVLAEDKAVSSIELPLYDSSLLPTTNYPYPLLVGSGTENEEMVLVYDNDTITNTLTISALTKDQSGFKSSFLRRELLLETFAGRTFIRFDVSESRCFPSEGWLRLDANSVDEEVVYFTSNDVDNDVIYLKTPLKFSHVAGTSVELLRPGASVKSASLTQPGIGWEIFDATNRDLKIYIPPTYREYRILDVTYLHTASPGAVSTTLDSNVSIGDTVISLTSIAGFPSLGLVQIDGNEVAFYYELDEDNATITLINGTLSAYSAGDSVDVLTYPYSGSDLEDSNVFDILGDIILNVFPGKYLFDAIQQSPSSVFTTLDVAVPPPTRLLSSQLSGFTNIEVEDASMWGTPIFSARIGSGTGSQEDLTVTDVTIAKTTSDQLNGAVSIGGTSLVLDNTSGFPESGVVNMAGYRVIIDEGTVDEEIVRILDNDVGTNTFTCVPLVLNHADNAVVSLLNDTVTFSTGLNNSHDGDSVSPTVVGDSVEVLTEFLEVVSVAGFSNSGKIIINYGNARSPVRAEIIAASPGSYTIADSSVLPEVYPYQLVLGQGLSTEEYVFVTNNNTGTGVLTVTGDVNTHFAGEYIEFRVESPEVVNYQDIDSGKLQFIPPVVLNKHEIGEQVMVTNQPSEPSLDGFDYPFYLPPDRFLCLTYAFGLVRGAGIQVSIVNER